MNKQIHFWATNIKRLRLRRQLSQEQLAEKLGISRPKLNAHENGKTINPPLDDLIRFSHYFKMSIDTLVKEDLSKMSDWNIRELLAGNDQFATGSNLRVLATTVDAANNENAEYVPIKAKAGYAGGYADPEYIAALPKFSMPQLPQNRTYRMFPTTGDSMLPIPEGCLVIGEYVQDWKAIKDDTLCIVILKNAGPDFVFKQVKNCIEGDRKIVLHSLNPEYLPYDVPIEEVLEIWKMINYVSDTVPAGNVSLSLIASSLKAINVKLDRLPD